MAPRVSLSLKVAVGLMSLAVSVLCAAHVLGLLPGSAAERIASRRAMCETLAVYCTLAAHRDDLPAIRVGAETLLRHHAEIAEIRVTDPQARPLVEVRQPDRGQTPADLTRGEAARVPITRDGTVWGNLEVHFAAAAGHWAWLNEPVPRFMTFVIAACGLVYWVYLHKVFDRLGTGVSRFVPDRVRSTLDTLTEGVLVIDGRLHVAAVNRAFCELTGQPARELEGRPIAELGWLDPVLDGPPAALPWGATLQDRQARRGYVLRLRREGGRPRTLRVNAAPIAANDGRPRGVLVTCDDISAEQRRQGQLRRLVRRLKKSQRHIRGQSRLLARSRRAAEAANAAKSEFLANMSHEIRTPMTAILGFAEVLLEQLTAPDQVDALRTIRRNGHYLLGLINDILDLSKIEAGKLTLESIATAPAQLVRDVLELLRIRAAEKNLSLQARFEGPIPELIQTDPTRLRQILINLASNAIKFTQQGGVTIGVRLLNDGEQPWLRFDITDTGIGMTPEQAARIFHPFVQADTSTTRRFGGTGLGLAISRRLVEMLGGEISFTTAPGHGSTFTVTIPTGSLHDVRCWQPDHRPAPLPVATAAPTSAAAPSPGLSQAPLEGRRILLAEDGPDNQRLIALLLRKSGAEVELAENGQQARDKALAAAAQGRPFDVILMDMQMPVLDGYDATRQLRQGGYTAPILALTAHAMSGDRQHCLDAGCDDYAAKPVDRKQLMDVVVQWCAAGEQYEPTRSSPPCTP